MTPPILLTIAGSDPSAGAGIQADLKTFAALGAYGVSVITTITAQNTLGTRALYPLSADVVRDQLLAVLDDFDIAAIKIGMVGNREIAGMLAQELRGASCPIVLDPIARITSDSRGISTTDLTATLGTLISRAYLLTPNIPESEALSGILVDSTEAMQMAGEMMLMLGAKNVLVKGGHAGEGSDEIITDVLVTQGESYRFTSPRIASKNLHGTGCTLSSAIATMLALGEALPDAVRIAKEYVSGAIAGGSDRTIGHGSGPLDHFFAATGAKYHFAPQLI